MVKIPKRKEDQQGAVLTPGEAGKLPEILQPLTPEDFLKRSSKEAAIRQNQSNLSNVTNTAKNPNLTVPTNEPALIKSGDTGAVTGVQFPDTGLMGSTYFGNLPPGHVQSLIDIYNQRLGLYDNVRDIKDINKETDLDRLKRQREQALSEQLKYNPAQASLAVSGGGGIQGNTGFFGTSDIDMQQAFTSSLLEGTLTALGGAAAAAGTGAVLGGSTGIPQLAIIGGIGGFAVGLAKGIKSNIAAQRADTIRAQERTLTDGRENLNRLIELMRLDPANAEEYLDSYNDQKDKIAQAYYNLKQDTQSDLNKALTKDGTVALQSFENFYAEGGREQVLDLKMRAALVNPNPNEALKALLVSELNIGDTV